MLPTTYSTKVWSAAVLCLSALFTISRGAICYKGSGNPWVFSSQYPIDAWVPCLPEAEVSACCSLGDFCMTNGLCMDSTANNFLTQQGCTDRNWSAPCNNYCPGPSSEQHGYLPLPRATPDLSLDNRRCKWVHVSLAMFWRQ